MSCPFCEAAGGDLVWQNDLCRVVLPDEPDYPGFCRVILQNHVKEMTDLPPDSQTRVMKVVFVVEQAVRQVMLPDKVNLASLGNMVPHVHWHVIPRYADDKHFPASVWSETKNHAQRKPVTGWKSKLCHAISVGLSEDA